jgi:hypothetical protein
MDPVDGQSEPAPPAMFGLANQGCAPGTRLILLQLL